MKTIINTGRKEKIPLIEVNFIVKSEIIASNIWPAVKLAASLIPKATGLETLLSNSIITRKGDIKTGAPPGKKLLK